jgi:deoxyadenosine/deoxycytidine kinase
MTTKNMRLAITGPVGSGKTSLANTLAQKLHLAKIPENWAMIPEAKKSFIHANKSDQADDEGTKINSIKVWAESYFEWVRMRDKAIAETSGGYILDRWEVDALANWLVTVGPRVDEKYTKILFRKMQRRSQQIDLIIILPLQGHVDETHNSEKIRRNLRFDSRLANAAVTRGLITDYCRTPIIKIPGRSMSMDERVELVIQRIKML